MNGGHKPAARQVARRPCSSLAPHAVMPHHDSDTWKAVTETYERARHKGAAYQTDTSVQLLRDPSHDIEFVLRVAAALRDKPKPPKGR